MTCPANPYDIPTLITLMTEFYAESKLELDPELARMAFSRILRDPRLGFVWMIKEEGRTVGYLAVTLRFGMEYGGMMACLDDLFVLPASRNRGLSSQALSELKTYCLGQGLRAITVEVGDSNGPAQNVYRRVGFADAAGRQLLVLPLASPSHRV